MKMEILTQIPKRVKSQLCLKRKYRRLRSYLPIREHGSNFYNVKFKADENSNRSKWNYLSANIGGCLQWMKATERIVITTKNWSLKLFMLNS